MTRSIYANMRSCCVQSVAINRETEETKFYFWTSIQISIFVFPRKNICRYKCRFVTERGDYTSWTIGTWHSNLDLPINFWCSILQIFAIQKKKAAGSNIRVRSAGSWSFWFIAWGAFSCMQFIFAIPICENISGDINSAISMRLCDAWSAASLCERRLKCKWEKDIDNRAVFAYHVRVFPPRSFVRSPYWEMIADD